MTSDSDQDQSQGGQGIAKRENGCQTRPYKWLGREEKLKAKEKRKDILI